MCVVVDDGPEVRVHALYATLKLNDDSARRLGLHDRPTLGTTPKGKRVLAIDAPLRLLASAPVCAIVALESRGPAASTTPRRLSARDALGILVPTGLNAALGAVALDDWFSLALRLAKAVPAFAVARDWDLPRVVGDLAAVVDHQ
ncbi:MAG: hypothetical protein U0W40_16800 [Acidimicrobiia bacterium]